MHAGNTTVCPPHYWFVHPVTVQNGNGGHFMLKSAMTIHVMNNRPAHGGHREREKERKLYYSVLSFLQIFYSLSFSRKLFRIALFILCGEFSTPLEWIYAVPQVEPILTCPTFHSLTCNQDIFPSLYELILPKIFNPGFRGARLC